jgi:hypothetical protein
MGMAESVAEPQNNQHEALWVRLQPFPLNILKSDFLLSLKGSDFGQALFYWSIGARAVVSRRIHHYTTRRSFCQEKNCTKK